MRAAGLGGEDRRSALLDQLRYLLLEVDLLGPLLNSLPDEVLAERPAGERSMLETFAYLAALDREVHLKQLRAIAAGEPATAEADDVRGLVHPDVERALADVREAREALVAAFEAVPAEQWDRPGATAASARTVHHLALEIAHRDAELLRSLAYHLHESPPPPRHADRA